MWTAHVHSSSPRQIELARAARRPIMANRDPTRATPLACRGCNKLSQSRYPDAKASHRNCTLHAAIMPATIIEIGSLQGGAAVWMGDLLNTFSIDGRVISIDLRPPNPSYAPSNVKFLRGDADDLEATLGSDFFLYTTPTVVNHRGCKPRLCHNTKGAVLL